MNSNRATIPTMMFSISSLSHFLAEVDVHPANHKEKDHQPDINEIRHSFNFHSFTREPAISSRGRVIKSQGVGVKNASTVSAGARTNVEYIRIMKTIAQDHKGCFAKGASMAVRNIISATIASMLLTSCSNQKPQGVTVVPNSAPGMVGLSPGVIAVTSPAALAAISFDLPQGKVESAAEGAADAASGVLDTPSVPSSLGGAYTGSALGVLEFVASPFVAAYGAIRASHLRLTPNELSNIESGLTQAMHSMADQKHLAQLLPESARRLDRCSVISLASASKPDAAPQPVGAVLEVQVNKLQLQRLSKSDGSYVLCIAARARVLSASGGTVLCDRPYEYCSGKAMFIDWASQTGFERAAQTGYQTLADRIAAELLPSISDQPLLLGAGYPSTRVQSAEIRLAGLEHTWPATDARVQRVGAFAADAASIAVYAPNERVNLIIQRPLTRQEAVDEAVDQNGWTLDGLQDDPNVVVQAVAQVAAVPGGIWKQIVALVRGRPERSIKAEEARLEAAAHRGKPTLLLAKEVAQYLAPQTAQPVLLAAEPSPLDTGSAPKLGVFSTGTPKLELVRARPLDLIPQPPSPGTALEIRVLKAELSGKPGINPPMALCFEAKAILYRTADGQELYSCPLSYRSNERPFKAWASANARLFHEELSRAYAEMGKAIAHQLASQGMVSPSLPASSTVVKN